MVSNTLEKLQVYNPVTDPLVLVTTSLLIGQFGALSGWYLASAGFLLLIALPSFDYILPANQNVRSLWSKADRFCCFYGQYLLSLRGILAHSSICPQSGILNCAQNRSILFTIFAALLGLLQCQLLEGEGGVESFYGQSRFVGVVKSWIEPGTPGELRFGVKTEAGHYLKCTAKDLPWRNAHTLTTGAIIKAEAKISPFSDSSWGRREKRRGYDARCEIRFLSILQNKPSDLISSLRESLESKLQKITSQSESGGIVKAILIGKRNGVSRNLEKGFERYGISHLLVVSGLHIGFLYWAMLSSVSLLFVPFSFRFGLYALPKIGASIIGATLVWFYVLLLGFPLSATRAAITLTLLALSRAIGLKNGLFRGMIVSIFILVSIWPGVFEELGFQLTYTALLGIFLALSYTSSFSNTLFSRLKKFIIIAVSPSLTTGVVLYIALGKYALLAPLGNLFLSPLILFFAFFGGAFSLFVSYLYEPLGVFFVGYVEVFTGALRDYLI